MKASVVCSKKSKPEIILIIFFFAFFSILFPIKELLLNKMQNSDEREQEQNAKFQTILRNQVLK